MDRFAIILSELSELIDIPLHPDQNRSCSLNVNNTMHVQLQEEENKDRLLLGAFIGELPPGKFREKLLIETLKENNLFPRVGTFSYSPRNNQLHRLHSHLNSSRPSLLNNLHTRRHNGKV